MILNFEELKLDKQFMPNWQYQMAMTYYKMMRQVKSRIDLAPKQIRGYMDALAILTPPAIGFESTEITDLNVPLWKVEHKSVEKGKVIFFIHGGAFAFGSVRTHKPAAYFLSKRLKSAVYLPEYRTTPEHNFPLPLEDCLEAWKKVTALHPDEEIYVVGDSAGGNLSAALTYYTGKETLRQPDKLVLMSPWLDLRPESKSSFRNYCDESIFDKEDLQVYARHYLGGRDSDDPLISPLTADVSGFPKTFIQVATNELLYPDSQEFFQKLQDHGVEAFLDTEDNLFHSWQLLPDYLPAAKRSLEKVAEFLDS
ncbi:MAG: alpha/beta hydrolase [Flavobacteriales bacterium]|nr:alpha/beta hydrolase [Flavobacteriales bacterium]